MPTCCLYGLVGSLMMGTADSYYVPIYVTYCKANTVLGLDVFRLPFERITQPNSTYTARN
jgi:hypothetical protein